MALIHVEVTQEDIDNGKRQRACACPVYLALTRATEASAHMWQVRSSWLEYGRPGWVTFQSIDIPFAVEQFVSDFDNRQPVRPFSFDIEWQDVGSLRRRGEGWLRGREVQAKAEGTSTPPAFTATNSPQGTRSGRRNRQQRTL